MKVIEIIDSEEEEDEAEAHMVIDVRPEIATMLQNCLSVAVESANRLIPGSVSEPVSTDDGEVGNGGNTAATMATLTLAAKAPDTFTHPASSIVRSPPTTTVTITPAPKALTAPSSTTEMAEVSSRPRTRHRRKSVHQQLRASPDMQFQTIAIDGEETPKLAVEPTTSGTKRPAKIKYFKTTPNILSARPAASSEEQPMQMSFDDFLSIDDSISVVSQIVEERVRVNYLLNIFGMPEINFLLYAQYEQLQLQFADRMKHLNLQKCNWPNSKESQAKKPRLQQGDG